jgi:hypothetical protein
MGNREWGVGTEIHSISFPTPHCLFPTPFLILSVCHHYYFPPPILKRIPAEKFKR